jgi:hypothetical protein
MAAERLQRHARVAAHAMEEVDAQATAAPESAGKYGQRRSILRMQASMADLARPDEAQRKKRQENPWSSKAATAGWEIDIGN